MQAFFLILYFFCGAEIRVARNMTVWHFLKAARGVRAGHELIGKNRRNHRINLGNRLGDCA
jgi:hypothetical protein